MPANPANQIEPFFFGPSGQQLFGCYHEPSAWPSREQGVVLCYPFGQEYIRSHRAYHQLAIHAAQLGFPVLRFDYFGTGDSQGDDHEAHLDQWGTDLELAVDELRTRGGVDQVILVGLRLGASLALGAAGKIATLSGLVLWDPVVDGRQYIEELRAHHDQAILRFFVQPKDYHPKNSPTELLGFAISAEQLCAIQAIDLLRLRPPNKPVLLIESQSTAELAALAAHLQSTIRSSHQYVPSFTIWLEDVDKGLVPQQVIAAITDWLALEFA